MTASIVSIRMPISLLKELHEVSQKDHFKDLSEAIRSITRQEYLKQKDSLSTEISHLRNEIKENLQNKGKKNMIKELKKILEDLSKDDTEE